MAKGDRWQLMQTDCEVCVMQDAATVLSIIRERSERGLPLEHAYRLLYNPTFYLYAYGRISTNNGAMTPGMTGETADGMSLEKIQRIIALIRREAYVWTPVRRIHIPKKSGGENAHSASQTGATSCCKKWCASSLKPTTNPASVRAPTGSGPTMDATPLCRR